MATESPEVVVLDRRIAPGVLARLVQIRPAQGNPSMEIESEAVRRAVRAITFELVGEGDALP